MWLRHRGRRILMLLHAPGPVRWHAYMLLQIVIYYAWCMQCPRGYVYWLRLACSQSVVSRARAWFDWEYVYIYAWASVVVSYFADDHLILLDQCVACRWRAMARLFDDSDIIIKMIDDKNLIATADAQLHVRIIRARARHALLICQIPRPPDFWFFLSILYAQNLLISIR